LDTLGVDERSKGRSKYGVKKAGKKNERSFETETPTS